MLSLETWQCNNPQQENIQNNLNCCVTQVQRKLSWIMSQEGEQGAAGADNRRNFLL